MRGLIACSSSSVNTKRFAANHFHREPIARLTTAEDQLLDICRGIEITCRILRTTLIYGVVGSYVDGTPSRLIALMRRLPLLSLDQTRLW